MLDDPFKVKISPKRDSAVCAVNAVLSVGEVMVLGHYRYTVVSEISRDEFEAQRVRNVREDGVAGNAILAQNAIKPGEFESGEMPSFDPKHYYRMIVEFARGN